MSFSLKALEYEQVERLVGLLNKQLPLHGCGNFPTLEVGDQITTFRLYGDISATTTDYCIMAIESVDAVIV